MTKAYTSVPSGSPSKKRSLFDHTTADTEDELLLRATVAHTLLWETILGLYWTMCRVNLWVCAAACCVFIFRIVSWKKHTNVIDGGRLRQHLSMGQARNPPTLKGQTLSVHPCSRAHFGRVPHRMCVIDGFQLTATRIDVRKSWCVGALKQVHLHWPVRFMLHALAQIPPSDRERLIH